MGKTPRIFAMLSLDLELSCPYFPIYQFPLSTFITSPEFSRRLRVSEPNTWSLWSSTHQLPPSTQLDFQVLPLYKVWERKKTPIAAVTLNLSLHTGGRAKELLLQQRFLKPFNGINCCAAKDACHAQQCEPQNPSLFHCLLKGCAGCPAASTFPDPVITENGCVLPLQDYCHWLLR